MNLEEIRSNIDLIDDKIADHFPEFMPENPHPYILQTKIEDMLRMSVPLIRRSPFCL